MSNKHYFAPSNNGFYQSGIHGKKIPADAIEIAQQEMVKLRDGQYSGQVIVIGEDGRPKLADGVKSAADAES